ncbi:MAG: ABC transporter ATP-binding protein [Clostridiales bacterium]|nr:ABC transporter ATP-binding protein [Clostridiales bacterium]
MIKIEGLSHSFGKNTVLEDVDLEIGSGKVLGLVGINGAGKSTLLRLISGVYKPQKGKVTYDGKDPGKGETRRDLFLLPDDPYYGGQTTCNSLFGMYKTFYPGADEKVFRAIIDDFALPDKKPLRTFSKGMRRQAFVAMAFAVSPKYLLLDEAFDGLDPLARKKFKERLSRMVKEKGSTVIISSHSLKELEDFCDEFVMIDEHKLIASGKVLEDTMDLFKYQIVFKDIPEESVFADLNTKSVKITGHVATVVVSGKEEEIQSGINALSPLVVDKLDVGFEEAFIGDIDKRIRGGES